MSFKKTKKTFGKSSKNLLLPKRPFSKMQIVLFFAFLLAIGFYIGMQYELTLLANPLKQQAKPIPPTKFTCTHYAFMPDQSEYLENYTVKPGDSLLSIARTHLQNVARVDEIIALNKDNYPDLSITNSFLEQGMTLYLPDKNWPPSDGLITEIEGQVTEVDSQYQFIVRGPDNFISTMQTTENSLLSQNRKVKVGDCFKAIIEVQNGDIIYGEFLN